MSRHGPSRGLAFFLGLAALAYGAVSAGVAWLDQNECDGRTGGAKHWVVAPPGWECGAGGVELTE